MDRIEELAAELEATVDRHGMASVLESLAVLATLKAEHVETNWQDRELARSWKRVASRIQQAALTASQNRV
jgi:hypothetical protein